MEISIKTIIISVIIIVAVTYFVTIYFRRKCPEPSTFNRNLEQDTFNRNSNRNIDNSNRPNRNVDISNRNIDISNRNINEPIGDRRDDRNNYRNNRRNDTEQFHNENSDDEKIIRRKNFADNRNIRRKVQFIPEPDDLRDLQSISANNSDRKNSNEEFRINSEERNVMATPQDPYFSSLE